MNRQSLFTSSFKEKAIFVLKLLLFFAFIVCYINHILPQYEYGYDASLIDKVNRLESISSPKIVLLGNSNVAFGMNSKTIEEAMGMPVVNMGHHGGNGNAFHEEMAKLNVVEGDIYVLCHNDFVNNDIIDPMVTWTSIENHFKLWRLIPQKDIGLMVKTFPTYLKKSLQLYSSNAGNQHTVGVYSRDAFNKYGDIALTRVGSDIKFDYTVYQSDINDVTIDRINRLNRYLNERGATLLIAGYPIGNGINTVDAENFVAFQNNLADKVDCPVISNYVDYMIDYSYFYDTNAHLTTAGVDIRTSQLVEDLLRWEETGTDANMEVDTYSDIISDVQLSHIDNIKAYSRALNAAKDRYTIIIFKEGNASLNNKELSSLFCNLGFFDKIPDIYDRTNYVGIMECGNIIYEESSDNNIKTTGSFDNNRIQYNISSSPCSDSDKNPIMLNMQGYSSETPGLNIVVYSNETHRILDAASIDYKTLKLDRSYIQ